MIQPRIALSKDVLSSLAELPRHISQKVTKFVEMFDRDPKSTGINFEVIRDSKNPNLRSVRIDQAYRGIILHPEKGNVYVLLKVAMHDDAYDWARRATVGVNPQSGTFQVYMEFEDDTPTPVPDQVPVDTRLFQLRDRELRRLGVPEDRLEHVKAITSKAELLEIREQLPSEVYEALDFLRVGVSYEEVADEYGLPITPITVDTEDYDTALAQPASKASFVVPEDEVELRQMLEAPLEQWRVFLHPSQRSLVERHWNGPVRVLGGAGTGKTVVAMHRARWLARHVLADDEKVLFLTFTRNLAADIEANLRAFCSPAEMRKIEVVNIDAWANNFLRRQGNMSRIVYGGDTAYEHAWSLAIQLLDGSVGVSEGFVREEWEQIILPYRIRDRREYFLADRRGRGTPLNRKQRAALWEVFQEARAQLHQSNLTTAPDAMHMVRDILEREPGLLHYRAAVIDEAQDLGPEALQLIRSIVPEDQDDLFIVGDGHQRIYGRRSSLKQCGVNIIGRGRRLRLNYRTSEEIRAYATAVLENMEVDDLDDGADDLHGYRSVFSGSAPQVQGFETENEELQWLAEKITELHESGISYTDMCITARTGNLISSITGALRMANIPIVAVARNAADDPSNQGVRVATMHRVKGLEYRHMFIVHASAAHLPSRNALRLASDDVERAKTIQSERSLLHVALTRAVHTAIITYAGEPSPLLP